MTWSLAFLLLFVQTATAEGSIEGTVVRPGTREPIQDARVALLRNNTGEFLDPTRPPPTFSVSSDAQGKFAFKDLEPGLYRLTFAANGYVRQEYGQRTFPGRGTLLNLGSGQAMKDLVVEMTPTGSVSGTIRDPDKRPLAGVPVQLMRIGYSYEGDRRLQPASALTRTDDRGEFRIYLVTPGRYYLNAGTPQGSGSYPDLRPGNEVSETFSNLYYPGVADLRFATVIDIHSGESRTGMDLTVGRQQGVRVKGRIVDSVTGQAPEKPTISLRYRDPQTGWDYDLGASENRESVPYKDGNFEFRNVLPGLFNIVASVDVAGAAAPLPRGRSPEPIQRIAYMPLEVASSDVAGIVLNLSPGATISGVIKVEGRQGTLSALNPSFNLGVVLNPLSNGARPSIPWIPQPVNGSINPEDGTFRLDNVMPGEYRVQVAGMGTQFYIKEGRFGATDILKAPFRYSGREAGSFELVLSPNLASVEGTVTDNRLGNVAGALVVLIPDQSRHRPELFKTGTTDQNGRFVIRNIPPGDYKLYAWEAIEPNAWFDLELARRFERYAQPVRLTESARQTIDARLISAN